MSAHGGLPPNLLVAGVSPAFAMEGLEVENGMVDLGDVLLGGDAQVPFTLKNNSPFEVRPTSLLQPMPRLASERSHRS